MFLSCRAAGLVHEQTRAAARQQRGLLQECVDVSASAVQLSWRYGTSVPAGHGGLLHNTSSCRRQIEATSPLSCAQSACCHASYSSNHTDSSWVAAGLQLMLVSYMLLGAIALLPATHKMSSISKAVAVT